MEMETIAASLERSLQNCSINNRRTRDVDIGRSSSSDDIDVAEPENHNSDTTLDLNSHVSLPYHWEQCLDLKTGEIYYINWRNGMKAKEDPRRRGDYYSEDDSWYDSEESSSESCRSSTREQHYQVEKQNVLVVAGCKSCFMYFMVPKQVQDCPRCCGQLLHLDRSQNGSP
ncbi:hypothetical protein L6164_010784 [Bauhinia variegata]|uniref:Uncharacterized protein n=1 Tax=Bauhinia variegata TaxID=167791 RepID=A0ACB9P516_BAUVA|nr:hypothetical protein L6164_010784 [Bauhinia variegata]